MKLFFKILGAIGLILIAVGFIIDEVDISFTEVKASEKISSQIPFKQERKLYDLTISKIDIDFSDPDELYKDGKVEGNIEFIFSSYGRSIQASSKLVSGIDYRGPSFYLDNPVFTDFKIIESSVKDSDKENFSKGIELVNKHKSKINGFFNKVKNKVSKKKSDSKLINFLDPKLIKKHSLKFAKDNISNFPIFTLSGDVKKTAASMALKRVYFDDNNVNATLSISQFIGKALLLLLGAFLAVMAGFGQLYLIASGKSSVGITDLT
jgi:hypothetical protein